MLTLFCVVSFYNSTNVSSGQLRKYRISSFEYLVWGSADGRGPGETPVDFPVSVREESWGPDVEFDRTKNLFRGQGGFREVPSGRSEAGPWDVPGDCSGGEDRTRGTWVMCVEGRLWGRWFWETSVELSVETRSRLGAGV